MAKKPAVSEEFEEHPHQKEDPDREVSQQMDSLAVVSKLIEDTILQKGAEHLYNKYLQPKIMPYVSMQTIELTKCQVHQNFLEHDTCEEELCAEDPLSHEWHDAEEPVASKIDPHVTDNVKHDVKHQFDAYGADLGDVMGLTQRSNSLLSTRSLKKKHGGKSKGLLRKMSMKLTGVGSFQDNLSSAGSSKGSKKKSLKKRASSIIGSEELQAEAKSTKEKSAKGAKRATIGAGNSSQKQKSIPDEEAPQHISWTTDINRPHEDESLDRDFIEMSIEKKRQRVTMEALHRAEKAQAQNFLLGVAGMNRKGGIPQQKLRGVNEADFFQKNNSDERGFTFNFDGTLVDFKKPSIGKHLQNELDFDTNSQATIKNAHRGKGKHHAQHPSDLRSSLAQKTLNTTDYAEKQSDAKFATSYSRQYTQKELEMKATPRGPELETAKSFQMQATKQAVIEFKNNAPSKVMKVTQGVTLVEKGKSVNGSDFAVSGKLKLDQYRKMHDPRQQQVADTMHKRSSEMQLRIGEVGEDPYRSFRRELIKQTREGSAQGGVRNQSTRSRDSRAGFSVHGSDMMNKSIDDYGVKAIHSQISLNKNKIIQASQQSMDELLADISLPGRGRDSMDTSIMMIEVSDIDLAINPNSGKDTRAHTTKGNEASLSIEPYISSAGRYAGKRNNPKTIVAQAREELQSMQQSQLPVGRMSVQGRISLPKMIETADRRNRSALKNGATIPSVKSLNSISVNERISVYRNDEERQSVMKMINDQQANYQRLLAKQRPEQRSAMGIPLKSVKPKSALETKSLMAFKKAAPIAPKQRRVSQLKKYD